MMFVDAQQNFINILKCGIYTDWASAVAKSHKVVACTSGSCSHGFYSHYIVPFLSIYLYYKGSSLSPVD